MSTFKTCPEAPVPGGRGHGGGLVEVDGRVVWGGNGVFSFDEVNSKWSGCWWCMGRHTSSVWR